MSRYVRKVNKVRSVSPKILLLFALFLAVGLFELGLTWKQLDKKQPAGSAEQSTQAEKTEQKPFDKTKYSVSKASSVWVVVNKGRILPAGYVPDLATPDVSLRYGSGNSEMKLRTDAARALEQMFESAAKSKVYLRLSSGYRSYYTQNAIYNREVSTYGQKQADRESARPGHSEHQTGLVADLAPKDGRCEIADCFADTDEGKWLAKNAYRYGFILRYPEGKESLTGYRYEPWHFRYVGKELAGQINKSGQTLEQFFSLPSYTSYPNDSLKL